MDIIFVYVDYVSQVKRFVAETKGRGEKKTTGSGKRAARCLGNVKYFGYHEKKSQADKAIVEINRLTDIKVVIRKNICTTQARVTCHCSDINRDAYFFKQRSVLQECLYYLFRWKINFLPLNVVSTLTVHERSKYSYTFRYKENE